MQYLEPCLRANSITAIAIIENILNYLEDIFGNPNQKNHAIEKFQELKIRTNLLSNFYSKFIWLASDLEYIWETLI